MKHPRSTQDVSRIVASNEPSPDFMETWFPDSEVAERILAYGALLCKWQKRINLISRGTVPEMWTRHFADSAQLTDHIPDGVKTIIDIGSGAGFPGLVLAAFGRWEVTLIESDSRKCAFLAEAARVMMCDVHIINQRIEMVEPQNADLMTARALAGLPELLDYAERHLAKDGQALFLKGQMADEELTLSCKQWNMAVNTYPSRTDRSGVVIHLGSISRRHGR